MSLRHHPIMNTINLAAGGLQYMINGRTPGEAYQSMIRLFCQTSGASNDRLASLVSHIKPPVQLPQARGVAGDFDAATLARITAGIDERGYHVFEQRLSPELCDRLTAFALQAPCSVRAIGEASDRQVERYVPDNPIGVRYDLSTQSVIDNADVQSIMADASIIAVAQSYLRSLPLIDVMTMWWSTACQGQPDSLAAQYFHFDMDRIKWLKFFIYLTDTGPEQGPHCYVEGSHRTGGIPATLLKKGYARLTDEEVRTSYPPDKLIEFTAPRGTILAEDTRGLHKGKHLASGHRLMLQLQFSNSLFGGDYTPTHFTKIVDPGLQALLTRHPAIYRNYY